MTVAILVTCFTGAATVTSRALDQATGDGFVREERTPPLVEKVRQKVIFLAEKEGRDLVNVALRENGGLPVSGECSAVLVGNGSSWGHFYSGGGESHASTGAAHCGMPPSSVRPSCPSGKGLPPGLRRW